MLKLSLHIERVVTADEAAAIAAIVKELKVPDVFRLESVPDEAPVAPSSPVIIPNPPKPAVRRRPWDRRVSDAFNMTYGKMPGSRTEIDALHNEFAWEVQDTEEWKPFPVDKLPETILVVTPQAGFHLIKVVLKQLGREPSKGDTVLLPPLRSEWLEKEQEKDRARHERNLKLTGDEHIGPAEPLPGESTMEDGFAEDLMEGLEWGKPERKVMSMKEFLKWANVKYNRGNAIKMGKAAAVHGGLKLHHRERGYGHYSFPLPKDFLPPYPDN